MSMTLSYSQELSSVNIAYQIQFCAAKNNDSNGATRGPTKHTQTFL